MLPLQAGGGVAGGKGSEVRICSGGEAMKIDVSGPKITTIKSIIAILESE